MHTENASKDGNEKTVRLVADSSGGLTHFVVDWPFRKPEPVDVNTLLSCCLVLTEPLWLCRADGEGASDFVSQSAQQGGKSIDGATLIELTRAKLPDIAGFVSANWRCAPGRWILAASSCTEEELIRAVAVRYDATACFTWSKQTATERKLAGITYDDSVFEGFASQSLAQAVSRWQELSASADITVEAES